MACGCNKIKSYSESSPLVIGEDDGEPPVQVRATVTIMGLKANSEFWAKGSGLAPLIQAEWLLPI